MKVKVLFHNLESSNLINSAIETKLGHVLEKFEDRAQAKATVIVSMENSRAQRGPDLFTVKAVIKLGRHGSLVLEKSDSEFYRALAMLADRLQDQVNRMLDKDRVRKLKRARQEVYDFTHWHEDSRQA